MSKQKLPKLIRYTKKDIINMDYTQINKMSERELRNILNSINDIVKKRFKRLEKAGVQTPAMTFYQNYNINLSPKGKTEKELRHAVKMGKVTLSPSNMGGAKTSTLRGYKEYKKEVERATGVSFKKEEDEKEKTFWRAYNKITESPDTKGFVARAGKGGSPQIMQIVREIQMGQDGDMDADSLYKKSKEALKQYYEEEQKKEAVASDILSAVARGKRKGFLK